MSTRDPAAPPAPGAEPGPSRALIALFAAASGITVASIYYAQPLIGLIGPELGMPVSLAGLIMTLTQLGYGAGLLFLVPLADVVENRRLATLALAGTAIALFATALARSQGVFLAASFAVGVCATATQVLVPFASHLTPEARRGKVVGTVMGGLLAGIMLARPFASFMAQALGWRSVYVASGIAVVALGIALHHLLPRREPGSAHGYGNILASLPGLVRRTPLLRRRAWYQGMMFSAFNTFWTGVPLLLMHAFGFDQNGVAVFALAGAAGALAAPWAGHLADRGHTRVATGLALAAVPIAFAMAALAGSAHSVAGLVVAALVLDAAVQVCQVLSLRSLYLLQPELRGRLNGLYLTFTFACGAVASGVAAAAYALAGWTALAAVGAAYAVAALLLYASEFRAGSR